MANIATITNNIISALSGTTSQVLLGDATLTDFKLDSLTDVSVPTPGDGDVLRWNGTTSLWEASDAAGVTGSLTTNYLPKATGATTLGNSVVQEVSSNIGIGISPTRKLHVLGGAGTAQIQSNTTTSMMYFGDTNSSVIDNQGVGSIGNSLWFMTNGAEAMRITPLNNLHIGTFSSDSGEKLQVTGTMKVTGASNFGGNITSSLNIISNNGTVDNRLSWSSTPAGVVGTISNHPLEFYTNGGVKMLLSASGNLGLGVVPSAWGAGIKAFDINTYGSIASTTTLISVKANNYFNGTNDIYKNTGAASQYYQTAGQYVWLNAASGTAGATITWSQPMTLTANGRLLLGSTSDTGELLQVTGTAKITGATTFGDNVNLNGGLITFGAGVSNSPYTNSSWIRGASGAGTFITNNGITAWLGLKSNGDLDYNGGFTILASTGAATFSSSVTAASGIFTANLTVDTNTLFVDAANNRVGIGTASPSYQFEIFSDSYNRFFATYPDSYTSRWNVGVNAYIQQDAINEEFRIAQLYGTGKITFLTSGGEKMRITSGGDVGIGTTAPAEKLDVFGRIQARPLANGSSGNYWYMIGSITDVTNFGVANGIQVESSALNSYAMTFGTQTTYLTGITEKMRITSAGNVGIGTTSPAAKLDVRGTTYFRGAYFGVSVVPSATGADMYFYEGNNPKIYLQSAGTTVFNTGYNFLIGTSTDTGELLQVSGTAKITGSSTVTATIKLQSGNVWSINADQSGIGTPLFAGSGFYIRNENTSTNVLGFNQAGAATFNSSVTASGSHGAGSFNAFIIKNTLNSAGSGKISWQGSSNNETWAIAQNQTVGATYLEFNYLGSNKAVLDASGNLGLGVTPSVWGGTSLKALELNAVGNSLVGLGNGDIILMSNAYFNSGFKYAGANNATSYRQQDGVHKWSIAPLGSTGGTITFTQAMTLDASGRLGIGIATPSALLNVNRTTTGSESSIIISRTATNNNDAQSISWIANDLSNLNYATINAIATSTAGQLVFSTATSSASGEAMRITALRNLHIGTFSSDSGEKLQVTGTAKITGATTFGDYITQTSAATQIILNRTGGTTYGAGVRYQTSGTNNWIVGTAQATVGTDYSIYNYNTGTGAINITYTTNNVQIGGTTDSGEKLQVTGTAKITGNLAVDGSTLFVDAANNRVGIGNAIPSTELHIQSSTPTLTITSTTTTGTTIGNKGNRLLLLSDSSTVNNGGEIVFGATDTDVERWAAISGAIKGNNASGAIGDIVFATKAAVTDTTLTERVLITSGGNFAVDTNTLFVDATNNRVGIGTAFPDNILHLVGGNSINSTLKIQASTYPMIDFISDDANSGNRNWRIASVYNAYGTFEILSSTTAGGTPTTSRFSITNDGNVGIGMTPSYKLDVTGSARVSDAIAIGTTPDSTNPFKILKNINATVGIKFENTNTSSNAFSAVQLGTDVSGGTKFTNLVYASSGVTASGVYNPDGTSLINNGNGGLNFLGNPIRMYTGGSNGVLRWDLVNDGYITHYSATAPTTSATDSYRQYSADVVAGNAAPHFRTENGAVIKLYQETTAVGNSTISVGGGNAVLDDTEFDGYTLRQIVKALRNQGILA